MRDEYKEYGGIKWMRVSGHETPKTSQACRAKEHVGQGTRETRARGA